MITKSTQQAVLFEDTSGGTLYQGCHPVIYGYEYVWDKMSFVLDVDNEWDSMFFGDGKRKTPMPEGCHWMKWKIEDGDIPDRGDLYLYGRLLAHHVQKGRHVLVHCAAGQNRSALVAASALYFLHEQRLTGEEIYKIIKKAQPLALTNYSFRNFVQTIEDYFGNPGVN